MQCGFKNDSHVAIFVHTLHEHAERCDYVIKTFSRKNILHYIKLAVGTVFTLISPMQPNNSCCIASVTPTISHSSSQFRCIGVSGPERRRLQSAATLHEPQTVAKLLRSLPCRMPRPTALQCRSEDDCLRNQIAANKHRQQPAGLQKGE